MYCHPSTHRAHDYANAARVLVQGHWLTTNIKCRTKASQRCTRIIALCDAVGTYTDGDLLQQPGHVVVLLNAFRQADDICNAAAAAYKFPFTRDPETVRSEGLEVVRLLKSMFAALKQVLAFVHKRKTPQPCVRCSAETTDVCEHCARRVCAACSTNNKCTTCANSQCADCGVQMRQGTEFLICLDCEKKGAE